MGVSTCALTARKVLQVPLPDEAQREAILRLTLSKHAAEQEEPAVDPALLRRGASRPLQDVARQCVDFSGSDLVELCSQAASMPVHECLAKRQLGIAAPISPLVYRHFAAALQSARPSTQQARDYRSRHGAGSGGADLEQMVQILQAFAAASSKLGQTGAEHDTVTSNISLRPNGSTNSH